MYYYIAFLSVMLTLSSCSEPGKVTPFWPEEKSPVVVGQKLIDDFFTRGNFMIADSYGFTAIHYAEACAAYGVGRMADALDQKEPIQRLADRYMKVITDEMPNTADHVDANVYGILPFELYRLTGQTAFLDQGRHLADVQWEDPRSDGLTSQTRFWIDDVWMIGSLQTEAYRITKDPVYMERAALEIDAYLKRLQQPNGLFYHGENIPFFWGRGNGWVAAGLAEVLSELPKDNPHYQTIVDGYVKMMDALVGYQAENGMWRQLIDVKEAWYETSSTAMFGYAMLQGVKSGILTDPKYTESYQKAWLALTDYVTDNGKVTDVCVGTGQQNNQQYYLDRPKTTGDYHGQAPMLWFAAALLD
jgi:unsaturated rhamnogalacturonyl hydrolase